MDGLVLIIIIDLLIIVTVCFLFKLFDKTKVITEYESKNKFAILIPARNEENVISNLLDSLNNQNYPKELYDIYVIPNNCNDKTEELSKDKAKILKYDINFKTKGEVLKKAFSDLMEYDAFIVFDADNVVDSNFIKTMNNYLCNGSLVVQCYRDSKNYENWLSYSYSIFYWLQNLYFEKINSSFISGTGFMIKKEVIKKYGFNVETLTEDTEFSVFCEINKIKIDFAKEAITYDEQPTDFITSWNQRKRWTVGVVQTLKLYFKRIIETSSINSFIILNNPVFNLIGLIIALLYLGNMNYFIILISSLYIFMIVIAFITISYNNKKLDYRLFLFPVFILSWIPINIIYLFKKDCEWKEIKHNKNL